MAEPYPSPCAIAKPAAISPGVLSETLSGQEGEEAGTHGVYAQVSHDLGCDAEEWTAVACGGQSASLIFKTVADSFPSPSHGCKYSCTAKLILSITP